MRRNKRRKLVLPIGMAILCLAGCTPTGAKNSNRLGDEAMKNGRYYEAVKAYQQAISYDNTNPVYFVNEGMAYLAMDEEDSASIAEECFQSALQLKDTDLRAYRGLGISLVRQERYQEAIEAFDKAVENTGMWVDTIDYDILEYRAEAEMKADCYTDAIDTYSALIELGYHEADNYYRRGVVHLAQYDRDSALKDFELATKVPGADYSLYLDIYYSLCDYGLFSQSETYIEQALHVAETEEENNLAKGEVSFLNGSYEEALDTLNQVPQNSYSEQLYLTKASCYRELGNFEAAEQQYAYYIKQHGKDYRVLNELASCQCKAEKYEDAINTLKEAMTLPGAMEEPTIKWNLILCYENGGYKELAYAAAVEYTLTYPEDQNAKEELEYLEELLGMKDDSNLEEGIDSNQELAE